MRFLADENLPRSITRYLQNKGFDVKDLHRTNLLEHPDEEIGRYASIENRIVLTFDKDFLIPQTIPPSFSVILFHFPRTKPKQIIPYLDALLLQLETKSPSVPFILIFSKQAVQIIS